MTHAASTAWLKPYLSRYKGAIAKALGLGLAASACAVLLMFTSGYLISATALAGTTLFSIMTPVACVQLFGFGRPLARYAERLESHDWVLHLTSDLRLTLFQAVDAGMDDPALQRSTGEYLSLLADDVAHLQNLYLRVVFPTAIAYLLALCATAAFGAFSLAAAGIMGVSLGVLALVVPYVALLATRAGSKELKALKAAEYEALADDVAGATDWILAQRGAEAQARHRDADARVRSLDAALRMKQRVFSLVSTLALGGLACWVALWAGCTFSQDGANVNWIAAFALGFFPLIDAIAALPVALSESTAHRVSVERLGEFVKTRTGSDVEAHRSRTSGTLDGSVAEGSPAGAAALSLGNVSYSYPSSRHPALQDICLSISQGEAVAVLGRSGAGKSTLANIMRATLKPQTGSVFVFGKSVAAGDDTSGAIAFIGQTPYLFNRTLRENLTMGTHDCSDAMLESMLGDVGLDERYSNLADGLDTIIGETGVGFSGGEAHRIAIARALVADTPIVLVDEPFSALDPETEHDLLNTLLETCSSTGKTLVVITHHLAEIERFDRVIFIEDSRIALDGAPSNLKRTSERFQTLLAFDR